jgi:hypothetical protein
MKKLTICAALAVTLTQGAYAADPLSSKKTQRFLKNFYEAMADRDDKKLDAMIANDASIRIYLIKMEQNFSLSKSQYLQQVKSAWHFGKSEKYKLKNVKYTLTQAGLSANLTLNMDESRTILDENLTQAHEMSVDLILIDDQIKISGLKTKTTF